MLITMAVPLLPLMKAHANAHFHHWAHGGEKRTHQQAQRTLSSLLSGRLHRMKDSVMMGGAVSLTDLEMMSSFLTQVCKCCRLMLCKVCKVSTVLTDNTKA